MKALYLRAFYGNEKFVEKYGDVLEVAIDLPTDRHADYPSGPVDLIGLDKVGGFR